MTIIPIGTTIWDETRYVSLRNILVCGLTSIAFAFFYLGVELPAQYQYLYPVGFILFLALGIVLLYIKSIGKATRVRGNVRKFFSQFSQEDWRSLFISGKTIGFLQVLFLLPSWFGSLPQIYPLTGIDIIDDAILFILFSYFLTGLVLLYKNRKNIRNIRIW